MYNSNNIAERIKEIAKQRGVAVKKVLSDAELGRNTMSNLKTSFPQSDSLAKIADQLDCSVDYLLGRTDNQQGNQSEIDPHLAEALQIFSALPSEKRKLALKLIKSLLEDE